MKEVNSQLRNSFAKLKSFPVPSLMDETPGSIILHMGVLCRDYGVNDIFISAMSCSRSKLLNGKVKRVNFLLKHICEENGYFFIDNSIIEIRGFWKNGMQLLESGKTKSAEDFIYF